MNFCTNIDTTFLMDKRDAIVSLYPKYLAEKIRLNYSNWDIESVRNGASIGRFTAWRWN